MDARDLFLDQHAIVHSAAVGGNKASAAERAFAGLQRRADARPSARGPELAGVAHVPHRPRRGHPRQRGALGPAPGPATTPGGADSGSSGATSASA